MMRRHKALTLAAALAVGFIAVTGIVFAQSRGQRADCPGRITCPLTGEEICRDKCPTIDPSRSDCPGRIVCPLTGKLVCKDRCPLAKTSSASDTAKGKVPPCCAKKG